MSPLPVLEHAWVVEAMVVSYNHVYKVVHNTKYHDLKTIGVSDCGDAPIASFQIEFLAMDDDPQKVVKAIKKYRWMAASMWWMSFTASLLHVT